MKILSSSLLCSSFAFALLACSSGTDPGGDGDTSTGAASGGSSNPGAGGNSNPGAGGNSNPGAGGGSNPGAGGGSNPGAGGNSNPGAGGNSNPGAGGDSNPGAGGGNGSGGAAPIDLPSLVVSGPGAYWQEGELMMGGTTANVTVNTATTYQTWSGWGGSFNEKGWVAMKSLSAEDRDLVLRLLFDPAEGAGFTYGRIPIGSSDYALDRYSLNETAGDFSMTNFSIERDKKDLIPFIKAAMAVNPDISFWASPWSPPTWMKDNNAFDKGNMKSDAQTLGAHALYLARFVEEYEKEGIIVRAVHPQNEPGYPQDYPSCLWSGATMANYIATHLGPLFADRLPNTEVWLGTMSASGDAAIVTSVMGNQTAKGFVKGIALQWNMSSNSANYASQYQIPIMQSEHQCGNFPSGGNNNPPPAPNDQAYAEESWGLLTKWIRGSVNSYMTWNMILDTGGRSIDTARVWAQNAPLAVDTNAGKLVITPTYYVFRHLAQFVHPGAVRVETQGGDALAFKNVDGSVITVLYNSGAAGMTTVSVGGSMYQFNLPSHGWATVNWKG